MKQTIKPSEVLAAKRWLLTADELEPQGWERELLLVVKDGETPYSLLLSRVEPEGAQPGQRTRFFATWAHDAVLIDAARPRKGRNYDDAERASLPAARARLAATFAELTGTQGAADDFEAAFKEANALFKQMKGRKLL
jgi:hypothetical protein